MNAPLSVLRGAALCVAVAAFVPAQDPARDPSHGRGAGALLVVGPTLAGHLADAGSTSWIDPARTERLLLPLTAGATAELVAGDVRLPFVAAAAGQDLVLGFDAGVRARLAVQRGGYVDWRHGGKHDRFVLHFVPPRPEAKGDERNLVCVQRRSEVVPGTRGWLRVRLGDITMGQVLLTVLDAEGSVVVPTRPVWERDGVVVPLAEQDLVLRVDRLVNLLIGDDRAEFTVLPRPEFVPDRVTALVDRIEAADGVVFVREGEEWSPRDAAAFLRIRVATWRGAQRTPERFFDVACVSSITGEAYGVRLPDGTELTLREWLEPPPPVEPPGKGR